MRSVRCGGVRASRQCFFFFSLPAGELRATWTKRTHLRPPLRYNREGLARTPPQSRLSTTTGLRRWWGGRLYMLSPRPPLRQPAAHTRAARRQNHEVAQRAAMTPRRGIGGPTSEQSVRVRRKDPHGRIHIVILRTVK